MGISRDTENEMRASFITKTEIDRFANAKKPDGTPQDMSRVVGSIPYKNMLESRRTWMANAIKPKALGGLGLTLSDAKKLLEKTIKTRGKKHKVDIFSLLRLEYRPKEKITNKKKFTEAITTKSVLGRRLGSHYSTKLKLRHNPIKRCPVCRGNGEVMNLERRMQMCLACSGSGVRRF
jgi:hypothetical protein